MTKDTAQFLQFIGLLAGMAIAGRLVIEAGPPRFLALPFTIVWIFTTLAGIGYIVNGKSGAKDLVFTTALSWIFIGGAAAMILMLIWAR